MICRQSPCWVAENLESEFHYAAQSVTPRGLFSLKQYKYAVLQATACVPALPLLRDLPSGHSRFLDTSPLPHGHIILSIITYAQPRHNPHPQATRCIFTYAYSTSTPTSWCHKPWTHIDRTPPLKGHIHIFSHIHIYKLRLAHCTKEYHVPVHQG